MPSSQIIKRFTGHSSRINSVAFNAESTLLASASFDATIRLWDLRSQQGRPIQVLQEAKDSVTHVAIGQGEIVAGSVDGHVRTYDLRAGELRTDFFDRELDICTVYFSSLKRFGWRLTMFALHRRCHFGVAHQRCPDYARDNLELGDPPDGSHGWFSITTVFRSQERFL